MAPLPIKHWERSFPWRKEKVWEGSRGARRAGESPQHKRKQPPRAPGSRREDQCCEETQQPPHREHSAGQEKRTQRPPSSDGDATTASQPQPTMGIGCVPGLCWASPYSTMRRVLPTPFNTEDRSMERKNLQTCIDLENEGIRTWTQVCLFQNQWPSVWSATSSYSLVSDCSFPDWRKGAYFPLIKESDSEKVSGNKRRTNALSLTLHLD